VVVVGFGFLFYVCFFCILGGISCLVDCLGLGGPRCVVGGGGFFFFGFFVGSCVSAWSDHLCKHVFCSWLCFFFGFFFQTAAYDRQDRVMLATVARVLTKVEGVVLRLVLGESNQALTARGFEKNDGAGVDKR